MTLHVFHDPIVDHLPSADFSFEFNRTDPSGHDCACAQACMPMHQHDNLCACAGPVGEKAPGQAWVRQESKKVSSMTAVFV